MITKDPRLFNFERRVVFHESDAMGVVHHANYLLYFEEARVAWLRAKGLSDLHYPNCENTLAVLDVGCKYQRPARVDDLLQIFLQISQRKLKVEFRYAIFSEAYNEAIVTGHSVHVFLNKDFRVMRIPPEFSRQLEKEIWIETWP